jgi:quinol-cytochrome oxidoreductase complex cytochrome b subunit
MAVVILVVTGLVLTVYYVSSPSDAHQSVQYITNVVPLGWLIRGLHHWAASALVVLSIAHLLRVVFHAAYKYPREFTWFTGIALLLLVFAFGLTGSLLPWDQRAYWATQVRIEIFATVPFIGDWLARFLQGGEELSSLTLSRFYSAHVWLLPLVLFGLVAVHLRLVVRHGISAVPVDEPRRREEARLR